LTRRRLVVYRKLREIAQTVCVHGILHKNHATTRRLLFCSALIVSSVVALCAGLALIVRPVSPTVAILGSVVLDPPGKGLPSNLRVRQSTPLNRGMVVYYTFDQTDLQGTPGECGFVSYVRWGLIGWQAIESYGGCLPRSTGPVSFTAVSKEWTIPGEGPWSEVHGTATDPGVDSLRVAWSDGTTHTAALIDGHYLVVWPGRADVVQIEALDRAGATVDTHKPVASP
jgi:hypothetical protein